MANVLRKEHMRYLLVVGSRGFHNYTLLSIYLDKCINEKKDICIVSGGAKGADELAKQYAISHKLEYKKFKADWKTYGKSAGYRRNEEMHKFISENNRERKVIAFWDGKSKGTQHNFELAKKYNNQIFVVRYAE